MRAALAALFLLPLAAARAQAPSGEPVRLGVVTILTGPAAGPFGIPGRNSAELLIGAINDGSMPAPYDKPGFGGAKAEFKFVDEAGSTATQVTELRNLVQRDQVDAVVGYISSGNCLAVAPVAEELQALTVFFDCGTPRIFEERAYKYVFRTAPTSTMDNVAAARYAAQKVKNLTSYSGINQNYAWGQDSWRDFVLTMKKVAPNAKVNKELFPKLFAGEYGAEISTLLTSGSQAIHTSFWGGDLESFILQSAARGLAQRSPLVLTTGETAMFRLGPKMPDGSIIGARGPHGVLAHDRYGTPPTYPAYHMAQAVLGLKAAYDKAAEKTGNRPTKDDVVTAFEHLEFQAASTTIRMVLGKGHQAVSDTAYGTYRFNKAESQPEIVDVVRFAAECVNAPENTTSEAWLEQGMPGAKCE
jgi:branched-chain amino acid transport system substrate-binding protein